jgi:hypothetical protein
VKTNRYATEIQTVKPNQKWEDTTAREIQVCIGMLIYMSLADLLEIHDYFLDDICVCSNIRQVMILGF